MKPDRDKEPGGPVPLAHKSLADVSIGLGHHLPSSLVRPQMNDPASHLRGHLGLSAPNVHFPYHITAMNPSAYSPFYGPNFNTAALFSSLERTSAAPPFYPGLDAATTANLQAILAASDPSRYNDLINIFRDPVRLQELVYILSKKPSSSIPSPVTTSSSSTYSLTSPSTSSSYRLPSQHNSSSPNHILEGSPPDKYSRASSLSPSSFMTPRSLNSSPSTPLSGPTFNTGSRFVPPNRMTMGNISPTSPPLGADGLNNNSSESTPTRKSSTPRPDRVFTCKICNRSFGYKHVLQNHERTHTGEKPFECKECHKRFTRDHHLKTHMRLHTGEKPYHCTHCDRQFVQVANLRRHFRVHTGEKPYPCHICTTRFSDSNQLKNHKEKKCEKPLDAEMTPQNIEQNQHGYSQDPEEIEVEEKEAVGGNVPYQDAERCRYNHNYEDFEEIVDEETSPTTSMDDKQHPSEKRRERKNKEPRRVVPNYPLEMTTPPSMDPINCGHLPPTPLPEQTEPEDLSISSSRRNNQATYRANIAVTTSSKYTGYPLTYDPSPIEHSIGEGARLLSNRFDSNGRKPVSPNL